MIFTKEDNYSISLVANALAENDNFLLRKTAAALHAFDEGNWYKKVYLILFFIGFLLPLCLAQKDLSLEKAIETSLRNNYKIEIQKLEGDIIANNQKTLYKKRLPTVSLNANQQNNINNTDSPTSFVKGFYGDNSIVGGLAMNWVLFDGFKIRIEKSRLEKLGEQNENMLMLRVETTVHATMLAYYDVLLKQQDLKNSRLSQKYSEERLKDAEFKFTKGSASKYDINRLKNSVLNDSTDCLMRKQFLAQALQQLNLVLGNKNLVEYKLTDQQLYEKKNYRFSSLQHKMFSLNGELQNQYLNMYLKKNALAFAKSGRFPKVELNGGTTQNFTQTKFEEIPWVDSRNFNFYMNLAISFNLFDGGEMRRQIKTAKIQRQIEDLKIEEIKRELSNQLRNAVSNYHNQLELVELNEELIKNLKELRDDEAERYRSGFSSLLDFQLLKQEFEKAEKNQMDVVFKLLQTEAEILKLTGGLLKYGK